jgi:hypothetical protein
VALDLLEDKELMEKFENISEENKSEDKDSPYKLSDICKQIKWNIETNTGKPIKQNDDSEKEEKAREEDVDSESKHVMISYNTASRDLCIKIKDKLESFGIKVWMDITDIHGSSLDSMAKAVEQSFCVLICITEKYRQSINCQSEAQYAFKLNKPIIPCIMQAGYENVTGWLGIIMGDKIFINFMKYEFDESIRRLKNEVNSFLNAKSQTSIQKDNKAPQFAINKQIAPSFNQVPKLDVESWDETKVEEWFKENKLNTQILDLLRPCNGGTLKQMYDIKKECSEFYYNSLKTLDMKTVIDFNMQLQKLF